MTTLPATGVTALRTAVAPIDHADGAAIVAAITRVIRESNASAGEEFIAGAIACAVESLPLWKGSARTSHDDTALGRCPSLPVAATRGKPCRRP